jgi:hypothetical protein
MDFVFVRLLDEAQSPSPSSPHISRLPHIHSFFEPLGARVRPPSLLWPFTTPVYQPTAPPLAISVALALQRRRIIQGAAIQAYLRRPRIRSRAQTTFLGNKLRSKEGSVAWPVVWSSKRSPISAVGAGFGRMVDIFRTSRLSEPVARVVMTGRPSTTRRHLCGDCFCSELESERSDDLAMHRIRHESRTRHR